VSVLRDALARIVFAREAVELGELRIAVSVLRDLEKLLLEVLEPRCPDCGSRAPTWELLQRHRVRDCYGIPRGRRR
jgi:hypothetical protein